MADPVYADFRERRVIECQAAIDRAYELGRLSMTAGKPVPMPWRPIDTRPTGRLICVARRRPGGVVIYVPVRPGNTIPDDAVLWTEPPVEDSPLWARHPDKVPVQFSGGLLVPCWVMVEDRVALLSTYSEGQWRHITAFSPLPPLPRE